jgi:hypothetical protein
VSQCACRWLIACVLLCSEFASAQIAPSQLELNGFLIGQYLETARVTFGNPFRTEPTDGKKFGLEAYHLDKTGGSYMVFAVSPSHPDQMHTIQITGPPGTDMEPFLGLRLGDPREAMIRALGQPSSTQSVDDPPVQLLGYSGRNYSVELDAKGRLFSIQVAGHEGFARDPPDAPSLEPLYRALLRKDVNALLEVFAPDFEIYRRDGLVAYDGPARGDLSSRASRVWKALYVKPDNLWSTLSQTRLPKEPELRLYPEKKEMAMVFKFAETSALQETVYRFYAGKWRVWEVLYRQK